MQRIPRAPWLGWGAATVVLLIAALPLLVDLLLPEAPDLRPQGEALDWQPILLGMHLLTDMLIGFAYVAISVSLINLARKAHEDIPFLWAFVAFGIFIIACGITHFMAAVTLWEPAWWLAGSIKYITAIASVGTAIAIPPLVPKALALISDAKLSNERKERLQTAHTELEDLYVRARELDDLKTQFFANVSHELRTPLALILGPTANLLAAGNLTDSQRREVEVVDRNARTLLKHVNDLLDVARLEAGGMDAVFVDSDLATLARRSAAHFESLARERRIDFVVDAPHAVPAQIDVEKMERVLLNLLSNAFKFTPDGGTVRCELRAGGGRAVLTVQDTGPGVPAAMQEAIFERFRQSDGGATRQFGGTGLGLAIAREFVTLHGGTIVAGDVLGGGALFTIELPLRAPAGATVLPAPAFAAMGEDVARQVVEELRPRATGPGAGVELGDRPLVLVVEDNDDMRRFVAETLATEYRVATAADGEEGLARALEVQPDLVVTDVMMPRMSGDQLLRALRERQGGDGVPVMVLTARADDAARARLLREGAEDYLVKPFAPEELRARAARLIETKRTRDVLQMALATREQDIEALAREVSVRKQEAETASRAKDEFLSTAAHELKTPVTAIKGHAQLLARWTSTSAEPRQARAIEVLDRQCDRLNRLVQELLDVSRVAQGRMEVSPEPLDLAQLAADVVEQLQATTTRHRLTLTAEPATVNADPDRIGQVLTNLLSNAIKFSPASSEVDVRVWVADGRAVVSVQDHGVGIPREKQARMFERFYRAHAGTAQDYGGMGIGLHLSHQLVQRHGGDMWFTSAEGAGSTFSFSLPLLEADPLRREEVAAVDLLQSE
jgi:signal transduction histidine kinase